METEIKVGDVMAKGVVTIGPGDTVKKACGIMVKHDLSGLTVVDGGKVVGMLTQGDLIPLIANEKSPASVKVKEIMGRKPVSIGPAADISKAAEVMIKNGVKRLPVLKKNNLVGVITQTDIVRIAPSVFDLIFEKAKIETGPLLEEEFGMSGECEECENYTDNLRNVNGTLVCEDCQREIESRL